MEASCLNCGQNYKGHFCPNCGQSAHTRKVTFATILHDIPHSVLHIDKGLIFTFVQLVRRPGHAIRDYLAGKRVKYFSPLSYLLLLSAISTFITHQRDSFRVHHPGDRGAGISDMLFPKVAFFFQPYPALMLFVLVPAISFWSWLFNLETKNNYWENFTLNMYLVAQFNLFFLFNNLFEMATGISMNWLTPMLIAFFLYFGYAYHQFFPHVVSVGGGAKRIAMYIVCIVTVLTGLTATGFMTRWWR